MYHNNESILYTQWKSKQFGENYHKKRKGVQVEIIPGILKKIYFIFYFSLSPLDYRGGSASVRGHDSHPL